MTDFVPKDLSFFLEAMFNVYFCSDFPHKNGVILMFIIIHLKLNDITITEDRFETSFECVVSN